MIKFIDLLKENLLEAKQVGDLYHFTSEAGAIGILKDNKLNGSKSISKKQISFTRNKNYLTQTDVGGKSTIMIRIAVDGEKLSNKYKVQPTNFFPGRYGEKGIRQDEFEEIIKKDGIDNIKNYIKEITIDRDGLIEYTDSVNYLNITAKLQNKKNVNWQAEFDKISKDSEKEVDNSIEEIKSLAGNIPIKFEKLSKVWNKD